MRTTVKLDPEVEALLKMVMREQGLSFDQAINVAIRAGIAQTANGKSRRRSFRMKTFSMGFRPEHDLQKALALADMIEDREVSRKMRTRFR